MFAIKVLVVFLVGVGFCEANVVDSTVVKTANGQVKGGYGETANGKIKYYFRSIPYAEPPLDDLRFEAPVPKTNWAGILDVSPKPESCIQGSNSPNGSEDCLYLQIFTIQKPDPSNNLPVMVYIYGGGFFAGDADFDKHTPDHLLEEGVIVAAINFRIGFLGFISTGDTVAPGNNELKDIILGLKWIKNNVKNFGGDPERITIFGQSAGAASVAYLLQTEETKGLFSRAIMQSGSTLSPWSIAKNLPAFTKLVASELRVDTRSSSTILQGLKNIDIATLQNTASSKMGSELVNSNPFQGLVLGPVAEPQHKGAVFTSNSYELLKSGKFHDIPLIVGYTSLEGYFDELTSIIRLWLLKYDLNPSLLVPDSMNLNGLEKRSVGSKIKSEYFGRTKVASSQENIMKFISDTQFEKPIQEAINLYSQKTKVYAYHFSYVGPLWGRYNRTVQGCGHTEDLGYLFDFGHKGSDQDYVTRNRMVKLWTNFAKTGNPTPQKDSLLQEIEWPANTGSEDLKFLKIDGNLSVGSAPNEQKMAFWKSIYRSNGNPPYSTY